MAKEQNEPKSSVVNQEKTRTQWDASVIIALIAVLISSASAFISLKESRIMLKQQQILTEQQAASVWPYLQNRSSLSFGEQSEATYQYIVVNKGIGPAIIDSVNYFFEGKEITGWGLDEAIRVAYPNLEVQQLNNSTLNGVVLAPGETQVIITEKIKKLPNDSMDLGDFLNTLDYHLEYCYCSVYGKCWKVKSKFDISPSEECSFRKAIQ